MSNAGATKAASTIAGTTPVFLEEELDKELLPLPQVKSVVLYLLSHWRPHYLSTRWLIDSSPRQHNYSCLGRPT